MFRNRWSRHTAFLLFAASCLHLWARDTGPRWVRIDSDHFSVLTDGDEKKARDIVVRFEQMRTEFSQLLMKTRVNLPVPFSIIALGSNEEFSRVAPNRPGEDVARGGFFVAGDDRDYFVLDLSRDESWRAISGDVCRVLLNYNYPPAQDWFDTGLIAYFSSLKLDSTQMQIGSDPESSDTLHLPGGRHPSFVDVLNSATWLTIPDLFAKRLQPGEDVSSLFRAQSWMVMEYLVNQDKLSSAGTYLGLVEGQKVPVEEAIQKAYGMTSAQLGQAVKDYFQALAPVLESPPSNRSAGNLPAGLKPAAVPVTADMVGTSIHEMSEAEGRALVAEMSLRVPEHREQALKDLASIASAPKGDNAVIHRALGWDHMERKEFDEAVDEFAEAVALDARDPLTHLYLALWKYREAQLSGGETKGLANMIQDLHIVLDWNHEFAEAHNMLAMAQLEGGGLRAATDSMHAALQLSPRNESYRLNMARIYLASKNWDAGTALLEHLTASPDAKIASAARQELQDIPYLKKYGIPPVHGESAAKTSTATAAKASPTAPPKAAKEAPPEEANDENSDQPPAPPPIDRRPIQYAKGKLVAVDCSKAPVAILTVAVGSKSLKLRTQDYHTLALVGVDQFSCSWTNQSVSVNYKAGTGAEGDLVSLEVQ